MFLQLKASHVQQGRLDGNNGLFKQGVVLSQAGATTRT
jgi:hypothetical protein